jgi:thiamine pyrophosphate-dependent acetolactate synthase large subunit-like protein
LEKIKTALLDEKSRRVWEKIAPLLRRKDITVNDVMKKQAWHEALLGVTSRRLRELA